MKKLIGILIIIAILLLPSLLIGQYRQITGITSDGDTITITLPTVFEQLGIFETGIQVTTFASTSVIAYDADDDSVKLIPSALYPIWYGDGANQLFGVDSVNGNIYMGTTVAGDNDVWIYFAINGSATTEYIGWDDGVSYFYVSDRLVAQTGLYIGNLNVGFTTSKFTTDLTYTFTSAVGDQLIIDPQENADGVLFIGAVDGADNDEVWVQGDSTMAWFDPTTETVHDHFAQLDTSTIKVQFSSNVPQLIFYNIQGESYTQSVDTDGNVTFSSSVEIATEQYFQDSGGNASIRFRGAGRFQGQADQFFRFANDVTADDLGLFDITTDGDGLTDSDGRQAYLRIFGSVNMSGTGALDMIYVNPTLTTVGDGSTGDGNNLINLSVSSNPLFRVSTDGDVSVTGYNRTATLQFTDDFDVWAQIGYTTAWDVTALKVGTGTNDITSNISRVTFTTDGAGANEKEGTRSNFAFVDRARKNRTETQIQLTQLTTTNFYWGWNDDAANAMVSNADKYFIIFYEVGTANWQVKLGDGTDEEVIDTGVVASTNKVNFEIWTDTDGTVYLVINTVEVDVSSFTNKLQADNHYLILGQLETTDGTAVSAQIDFIENEKYKVY
ncbi:MAG: hypothetical protein ACXAC7_07965 [Candidatus Hodarchaeales archaeon]|jgi:hypothetical protein